MMKKLLLALFLIAAPTASAFSVMIGWTNPSRYVDGSPLPAADIIQTRIEYGTCTNPTTFGTKLGEFIKTGNGTGTISPNLAPGIYCFRAFTKTSNNLESLASGTVTVTIVQPYPEPPTGLTATVQVADNNAYKLRQDVDGYSMVVFGTIPVGTACDPTKVIDGTYMLVQRSKVVPRSAFEPLPLMAFAKCG